MKIDKIIKKPAIRGVYVKPYIEIKNFKDDKKRIFFKDKDLFLPGTPQEKITYGPFSTPSIEQKPISPEIYNAFEIIIKSIYVEQANSVPENINICRNPDYYSPEKIAIKILELIKLLSNYEKSHIKELRTALIKGFSNATNALGGKLPNISYKTLELVLHDIDKLLTERN